MQRRNGSLHATEQAREEGSPLLRQVVPVLPEEVNIEEDKCFKKVLCEILENLKVI